jgi:hypothetical protein
MTWWLIGTFAWVALAVLAALVIGRAIRMADARRAAEVEAQAGEANFVATEAPPADVPPTPWTGPSTLPFPPPGSLPRQRPPIVRNPVSPAERDPSHRDSGVL